MDKQAFARKIDLNGQSFQIYDIQKLESDGHADIGRLPFSIRILVENLLRKLDGKIVTETDLLNVAKWQKTYDEPVEIPYHPARVLMQDFTGVPAVVDLAAMRDAVKAQGGDASRINPLIPVELIVDHSVQLDYYGTTDALKKNVAKEYERNGERYELLKWAQKSFDSFAVVPPNSGICHQVNLEYLGRVIVSQDEDGSTVAYPDTLVGTDSHTTMINAIGVMGWGVGGIEAEAVTLGQPYFMSIPEVIGVRMTGKLRPGVTATDLVLTVTQMLREYKVVEKFVEFFGDGVKALTVPDRATIANMSPEYGATMGFFPVDEKTIDYLKLTNRGDRAELVEKAARELGLFYTGKEEPEYTDVLEVNLDEVEPSLAGPARPQDRIVLNDMKNCFLELMGCEHERDTDVGHMSKFLDESGSTTSREEKCEPSKRKTYELELNGRTVHIGDGSVVIAAITSCTNTSNPFVLLGAGLLAKKAVERGLRVPEHVKTSLVPGSRVVVDYLKDAGLEPYLEALGFHLAGFGCTTCIGNSGPLHADIEKLIEEKGLTVAAVLSGNRNFEARIHQRIKGNYLGSPILVVAYALAGRVDVNLVKEPLGLDPNGEPVYLKDIWPWPREIEPLIGAHVKPEFYADEYAKIFDGDEFWQGMEVTESTTFAWDEKSTYIKNPPYFEGFDLDVDAPGDIEGARVLAVLGDSVTTDHISPAGAIPAEYPAGKYLIDKGVEKGDFNSYGSRRGNHEVMMRGTFGNIRIKNQLVDGKEGSYTKKFPEGEEMYIFDAAEKYAEEKTPLIVLGGKEYGTGSSRDWAAKGTLLLGVKAVIAESYERIHRSNLVGMGVLPLQFQDGEGWEQLGLDGSETYAITGLSDMAPRAAVEVVAEKSDGSKVEFKAISRLNTDIDVAYYQHGGILPYVLRQMMKS
jgi:aconitate hydratase